MGERRLFTEFLRGDARQWPVHVIGSAVTSLASGPGCFGPLNEWTEWWHFLAPRLVPLIDGGRWAGIYESLVTAFMAQYPDERDQYPYGGFLEDTLATLGRVPMSAAGWKDGALVEWGLVTSIQGTPAGPFLYCGGAMSAALFLHLKYLDPEQIPQWLASVLAIKDPIWRAKLVMWLARSRDLLLASGSQPSVLKNEPSHGSGWEDCWCLCGSNPSPTVDSTQEVVPFLSDARRQLFRTELQCLLTCASLEALRSVWAEWERVRPDLYLIGMELDQALRKVVQAYGLS